MRLGIIFAWQVCLACPYGAKWASCHVRQFADIAQSAQNHEFSWLIPDKAQYIVVLCGKPSRRRIAQRGGARSGASRGAVRGEQGQPTPLGTITCAHILFYRIGYRQTAHARPTAQIRGKPPDSGPTVSDKCCRENFQGGYPNGLTPLDNRNLRPTGPAGETIKP